MEPTDQLEILHISDLHISPKDSFGRNTVLGALLDRVAADRKKGLQPEIVVVTGDIAKTGREEEYALAETFFNDLLVALEIAPERLFIVPGNHDVDRKAYRPKDIPIYENMTELNHELEDPDYRADLLKGMDAYFDYIESEFPHIKPIDNRLVPFVTRYTARCGKTLGIVGLNSAWMCRKSPDEGEIAIGEYQIVKALENAEKAGKTDLTLFLFHHPLNWLWEADQRICRSKMDQSIILCGHLHTAAGGYSHDLDGKLIQFQSGASYLGVDSKYYNRYQHIILDCEAGYIHLNFRKFDKTKRQWVLDGETGADGRASIPFFKTESERRKSLANRSPKFVSLAIESAKLEKYLESSKSEHRWLPTQGFETNLRIPIELERVYVHLTASIQHRDFDYTLSGRKQMKEYAVRDNLSALDIEVAFSAAAEQKIKNLVILGDPGSGKTTLLKYILLMFVKDRAKSVIGIPQQLVPFFVPLRMLPAKSTEPFIDFVCRACGLSGFNISTDELSTLLDQGQAIILLDGLDEVSDQKTRIAVCKWIDTARRRYAASWFVLTSRFAGYLGESRLSGSCLELTIQDFEPPQIKTFLVQWFGAVEVLLHPLDDSTTRQKKGEADALNLYGRIMESDYLNKLAVNPLLLQIIALVHRDRGTLPQRRVELYEECINVLLERWDLAKGLSVPLSARQAREILQPLALWLHEKEERRSAPLDEILPVIKPSLKSIGKSALEPRTLLMNIRDRSGIFMGYNETEYGFTHLSFQEYLAAEQIRNDFRVGLLIDRYGDRWWKEVLRLCLALNNPSVFQAFLEQFLPDPKFETDIAIVADAMQDSIVKPLQPLSEALRNESLPVNSRINAAGILKQADPDQAAPNFIDLLENADTPSSIYRTVYNFLDEMGRAEGVDPPAAEERLEPIVTEIDQAPMVLIPAGPFLYGSREDDKTASSDEKPQRVIELPDFYMDQYPVTNQRFAAFLNTARPSKESLDKWINLAGKYKNEKSRISLRNNQFHTESGYENYPVIYVSWLGAAAYAKWAGKRLPTEQEWEKAARGTEGWIYPWGNTFDKNLSNTAEAGPGHTTPVDQYPAGKSPFECWDMAGNVWEWTDSWYDVDEKYKVLRGGSWINLSQYCRCAARSFGTRPSLRNYDIGFRCARI